MSFLKIRLPIWDTLCPRQELRQIPKRLETFGNGPDPTTVTDVRQFLGFTNYYRKFIKHYAVVANPLNKLISGENAKKKNKRVEWTQECEESFQKLKNICTETPVLAYADYEKPFKLTTDASKKGLGAVLCSSK